VFVNLFIIRQLINARYLLNLSIAAQKLTVCDKKRKLPTDGGQHILNGSAAHTTASRYSLITFSTRFCRSMPLGHTWIP